MFRRLLSFFGFGYYLPDSSDLGISGSHAPETDGQTEVTFIPGKRVLLDAEIDETLDERRKNLTDDSLVWPGYTYKMTYQNVDEIDVRVSLTVTDLEPSYYMRRPAIGGAAQMDGSVLLRPGEETNFEVVFTPILDSDKATPRNFSYVITRFDPRRANDSGEIEGSRPMLWVPLPKNSDFRIVATPPKVLRRPWRRAALFNLEVMNKSLLPPTMDLRILRAPDKKKLEEEPEQASSIKHTLDAGTGGVWKVLIPPPVTPGSYFATINGSAQVAENVPTYPLNLKAPVFVRYVPWLRLPKDWLFLFGGLFLILYLAWGIPWKKTPVVVLQMDTSALSGTSWKRVDLKVESTTGDECKDCKIQNLSDDKNGSYRIEFPSHWGGVRWPFGWNGFSMDPGSFKAEIKTPDVEKEKAYARFKTTVYTTDNKEEFKLEPRQDWNYPTVHATIAFEKAYFVLVQIGKRGGLQDNDTVQLKYQFNGEEEVPPYTCIVQSDNVLVPNLELNSQDKNGAKAVIITAIASDPDGKSKIPLLKPVSFRIEPGDAPVPVTLDFQDKPVSTEAAKKITDDLKVKAKQDIAKGKVETKVGKHENTKTVNTDVVSRPPPSPHPAPKPQPPQPTAAIPGASKPDPKTMLDAFLLFFTADLSANQKTPSSAPELTAAEKATNDYLSAAPNDALANGFKAFLLYREGKDASAYSANLDRAKGDQLVWLFTTIYMMRATNFGADRKDDIVRLSDLTDNSPKEPLQLRDCAYGLVGTWYSTSDALIGKWPVYTKKIKSASLQKEVSGN